ncbi:MAG: 23S rRNA (uracil(1939)-C(5))-methyltransferase RlmD, partial [Paramuribaculum sp.]|nr:23S rRNA (uracil(1939)-C(5))-methyltransferase RlmD [Paramuribaculum sp.]
MGRKRKELPLLTDVSVTAVAAEGNALAKWPDSDMIVFVPFGAPGDVADIKIDRRKRRYAEGHIERLITPSPIRREPRCSHFTICGGCRWQHLPYSFQLEQKQQQVVDALERIGKVEFPAIRPILGSQDIWEYRNKLEYTFSNKCWLTYEQMASGQVFPDRDAAGFHIPGAFDKVLDIDRCYLQEDFSNRLRKFIKQFGKENGYTFYDLRAQTGLLRTLMVRTASTGQKMAVMVFGEADQPKIDLLMEAVAREFPEITSLMYVVNLKANDTISDQEIITYDGQPYIEEEMEGLRFRVGPKSFYQTNSRQAYELYKVARDFAGLTGKELVYDLYTGTGTIANFVARQASRVIGIEYVADAIEDAKINSAINGISNTTFFSGDMKDVLTDEFIGKHGRPDVMIIDPPRAGMHQDVIDVILRTLPERIVYVSCNPATQARDLALLSQKYKIEA